MADFSIFLLVSMKYSKKSKRNVYRTPWGPSTMRKRTIDWKPAQGKKYGVFFGDSTVPFISTLDKQYAEDVAKNYKNATVKIVSDPLPLGRVVHGMRGEPSYHIKNSDGKLLAWKSGEGTLDFSTKDVAQIYIDSGQLQEAIYGDRVYWR